MKETPEEKKTYEPPRLVRVSLRPEEAVLGNCKISSAAGPGNASCTTLNCMAIAS